jgi:hypothetical protein
VRPAGLALLLKNPFALISFIMCDHRIKEPGNNRKGYCLETLGKQSLSETPRRTFTAVKVKNILIQTNNR